MQKNTVLQAVQQSLPPAEWPFVFEALRQDALLWSSLQDAERCARILEVSRTRVQDWSPASLALASLPHGVSLETLLAQPLQPLDPALRLGAARAYGLLSHPASEPGTEAGEVAGQGCA